MSEDVLDLPRKPVGMICAGCGAVLGSGREVEYVEHDDDVHPTHAWFDDGTCLNCGGDRLLPAGDE